jgi:N-methylhydantoinase A/oxoprolinase/acetone carboxylase beta subunit
MGGTHTDAVIIDRGEIVNTAKNPTDRSNLVDTISDTLDDLLHSINPSEIERINLSTTVSTNAIVEEKTAPVGMIIESGPGLDPGFLACGQENAFIGGYIDHRGREVKGFSQGEIEEAIRRFKQKDIQAAAVVAKYSVRNPLHEIKIYKLLEDKFFPVTMGHTISGKLNFPRRVFTSYLNSAVYRSFSQFSRSIREVLAKKNIKAPIYVLKADGGTMSLETGEQFPVNTILSGPAASLMGSCALYPVSGDAILLDIGGTTTDISFLADGVPLFEPLGIKIGHYPTLVRSIFSVSIGLGGDSSISVTQGNLSIGPRREGFPMALGGPKPTPSDAMIALGLLDFGNRERAFSAMEEVGRRLGLDPKAAAEKVYDRMGEIIKETVECLLREINSKPVYTVRELLYGKKMKPRSITVIGGPARALIPVLEKKFNIPCNAPQNYEVANAVGAALARTTAEITLLVDTEQGILSVPEMGVYKKIDRSFNLERARQLALELLYENAKRQGADSLEIEPDITEEQSYNMVRGFYTVGRNMRIKVQMKPGLLYKIRGVENAEG